MCENCEIKTNEIRRLHKVCREYDELFFNITEKNETEKILELREYYRKNFRNGDSDESFLMWIETLLNN